MLYKQHFSMYETVCSGNVELLERARWWGEAQYDIRLRVSKNAFLSAFLVPVIWAS